MRAYSVNIEGIAAMVLIFAIFASPWWAIALIPTPWAITLITFRRKS